MVRFKLSDPQFWKGWEAEQKVYVWVEFDEETNKEITMQMCEGNPQEDLRACHIQLLYSIKDDTLKFFDASLEEFDPATGEAVDAPFGNPDWIEDVTLELNRDEVAYIRENLKLILTQIAQNKK